MSTATSPSLRGLFTRGATRTIRCCLCGERFEVAHAAQSASCPHCYKPVTATDLKIKLMHWGGAIRCCGTVTVAKKARCLAKVILASEGVRIYGQAEADILCGGRVELFPGSRLKGAIVAPVIEISEGAALEGGLVRMPEDPIGRADQYRFERL